MAGRKVRLSISLPSDMVRRIDELRAPSSTSRSGFIRLALTDYLKPYPTNGDPE